MNWIFKAKQLDRRVGAADANIVLRVKLSFSGKPQERVMILDKDKDQWYFAALYEIVSVSDPDVDNPKLKDEKREIIIALRLIKTLKDKPLNDYIYSLKRVYNFEQPIRHFNRYSRLSDDQFEVILDDKIYYSRTIVGVVLNSLPQEHQEQFISYLAEESPAMLQGAVDYNIILDHIKEYLGFAVIHPSKCLAEAYEILKDVSPNEASQVMLVEKPEEDEDDKANDNEVFYCNINEQVNIIDSFLPVLDFSRNEEIASVLAEERQSRKNTKGFRAIGLPLKLKK